MGKKYLLFISCANCDNDYAKAFNDLLIGLGLGRDKIFFYSENGQGVKARIKEDVLGAIKDSKFFLFFLSPGYCKSQYCQQELGAAFITFDPEEIIPINLFQNEKETINPGFFSTNDKYYRLTDKDISDVINKINNPKAFDLLLDKIIGFLKKASELIQSNSVKKVREVNIQTNIASNGFSLPKLSSEIIICWYAVEYELSSFDIANVTQYIAKNDLDIDESSIQDAPIRLSCRNVCQFDKNGFLTFDISYFDFLASNSSQLNNSMADIMRKKVISKENVFAKLIRTNERLAIMCYYFLDSNRGKEEIIISFPSIEEAQMNFEAWLAKKSLVADVSYSFEDILKMLIDRRILYKDYQRDCFAFSKSSEHLLRNLDLYTKDAIEVAMDENKI